LQQKLPHDAAAQLHQALLDLYWATGQQDKQRAQALAFAKRCGRAPVERPAIGPEQREVHRTASFTAPPELDHFGVRTLQRAITRPAGHLVLDFSGLVSIAADAREPLSAALSQIHARQVELELHGQDCLLLATRLRSQPADASAMDLRLQVLHLGQDVRGFVELAAQHAAASASAPRVWMPARFTRLHPDVVAGETVAPGPPTAGLHPSTARLGDEIVGGDDAFLHALRTLATHAHTITVDLKGLRRMDFVAATALSNWVDAQQRLGKRVTLRSAHALLASLLQAVGLPIQA
jgi:anti-anti-sigma regulatory factor